MYLDQKKVARVHVQHNGVRHGNAWGERLLHAAWRSGKFCVRPDLEWRFSARSRSDLVTGIWVMGRRGMMIDCGPYAVNVCVEYYERPDKKQGGPLIGKSLPGYALGRALSARLQHRWILRFVDDSKTHTAHYLVKGAAGPYGLNQITYKLDDYLMGQRSDGATDAAVDYAAMPGGPLSGLQTIFSLLS